MKSFNYWKSQEVAEVFGLKEIYAYPLLEEWLKAECEIPGNIKSQLKGLQTLLIHNLNLWNEMEWKIKFLSPLFGLIDYDTENYRAFMERPIILRKGDEEVLGTVDFLIAKGKQLPRFTLFAIHIEHFSEIPQFGKDKPESNASKDPFGQLLITLVAIQQANNAMNLYHPVYGAYVVGQFFYFVILDGRLYSKSEPYTISKEKEIFDIFCILDEMKNYFDAFIEAEKMETV